MDTLPDLWKRALDPVRELGRRAALDPSWKDAAWDLLAWRTPAVLLQLLLGWWVFARLYGSVQSLDSPLWQEVLRQLPDQAVRPEVERSIAEALLALPLLPGLAGVLPWLLLLAPLQVLSVLIHEGVWDHGCLRLLGGARKGWRAIMAAEAEALKVGTLGVLLGLFALLPGVGCILFPLLAALNVYLWIYRGFALAAWHGCPLWKGILATVLHAVLLLVGALLFLGALLLMVSAALS